MRVKVYRQGLTGDIRLQKVDGTSAHLLLYARKKSKMPRVRIWGIDGRYGRGGGGCSCHVRRDKMVWWYRIMSKRKGSRMTDPQTTYRNDSFSTPFVLVFFSISTLLLIYENWISEGEILKGGEEKTTSEGARLRQGFSSIWDMGRQPIGGWVVLFILCEINQMLGGQCMKTPMNYSSNANSRKQSVGRVCEPKDRPRFY